MIINPFDDLLNDIIQYYSHYNRKLNNGGENIWKNFYPKKNKNTDEPSPAKVKIVAIIFTILDSLARCRNRTCSWKPRIYTKREIRVMIYKKYLNPKRCFWLEYDDKSIQSKIITLPISTMIQLPDLSLI